MSGAHARLPGLVKWYGGKTNLLARLLPLIPATRIYVEPFGGAASVMLNRKVSPVEVYNDIDDRLVGLMRVLQDPIKFRRLRWRLRNTPFSRAEFMLALRSQHSDDPVEAAWAFFVLQNQGFSGAPARCAGNWGRSFLSRRDMSQDVSVFCGRIKALNRMRARVLGIQVDSRDALDVMRYWDSDETTFYVDPPYVPETRSKRERNIYRHEMSSAAHDALVDVLLSLRGCVVVSGYRHEIYSRLDAAGWDRVDYATACFAALRNRAGGPRGAGAALVRCPRTESVWRNPAAMRWFERRAAQLEFAEIRGSSNGRANRAELR